MQTNVALAEDDPDLRRMLVRGLTEEGFAVSASPDGGGLLAAVERQPPDVLVIDIGLPDSDGRDVCQALRARGVSAPVLFLTARAALTDRLSGFHAGGDDYLVKPFAFKELVVRLQALIKRAGNTR
jgi:two-component system OmpR family response regulator